MNVQITEKAKKSLNTNIATNIAILNCSYESRWYITIYYESNKACTYRLTSDSLVIADHSNKTEPYINLYFPYRLQHNIPTDRVIDIMINDKNINITIDDITDNVNYKIYSVDVNLTKKGETK